MEGHIWGKGMFLAEGRRGDKEVRHMVEITGPASAPAAPTPTSLLYHPPHGLRRVLGLVWRGEPAMIEVTTG
jgi:hypothetical protein